MLSQALQHMMQMMAQPQHTLTGDGPLSPDSDMGFQTVEQQLTTRRSCDSSVASAA